MSPSGSCSPDACCGAAYAAGLASDPGADVVGVDFSKARFGLVRKRYQNVKLEQGDATTLRFDDGSFDSVVNGIGIPHFEEPGAAIPEAYPALRGGGRFAFSVCAEPVISVMRPTLPGIGMD